MTRTVSRPAASQPAVPSIHQAPRTSGRKRKASKPQEELNEEKHEKLKAASKKNKHREKAQKAREADEKDYGSDEDDNSSESQEQPEADGDDEDDEDDDSDTDNPHPSHRSLSIRDVEQSHLPKTKAKKAKHKAVELSPDESSSPPPQPLGRRHLMPLTGAIPTDAFDEEDTQGHLSDNITHTSNDDDYVQNSEPSRPKAQKSADQLGLDKRPSKRRKTSIATTTSTKITAVKDIPDKALRNVMYVSLRHHSAQAIQNDAYPGLDNEKEMIISSFAAGQKDYKTTKYRLNTDLRRLIKANKSTIRGRVRDATSDFVPGEYGLSTLSGQALRLRQRHLLEDFSFMYKDDVQRTGVYQRPIIQQVVNRVLFSGDHPLAIEYSEYFGDAVSEGALALILTAIQYSIKRLDDPTVGNFTEAWSSEYAAHLARIRATDAQSPNLAHPVMRKVRKALIKHGRVHAQVENKLAPQPAMVVDTTHLVADAAELAGLSDSSDEDAAAAPAPVGQL